MDVKNNQLLDLYAGITMDVKNTQLFMRPICEYAMDVRKLVIIYETYM
jgi:hypothetical protein